MRLSRVVSAVFHPCLLPIYAVITVLFSDTVYSFYTMRVKFYLIWVVVLYAAFIPMLAYFLFKRLDGLKRMSIDRSRLRMLMLMVGAVCYMLLCRDASQAALAAALPQVGDGGRDVRDFLHIHRAALEREPSSGGHGRRYGPVRHAQYHRGHVALLAYGSHNHCIGTARLVASLPPDGMTAGRCWQVSAEDSL